MIVASSLPEDGKLVACDIDDKMPSIGRKHWEKSDLSHKIDLRIGPAIESLDAMIAAGEAGSYDIAFIDADKNGYSDYYERCLELLRVGGLILIDNVLWAGRVADPENTTTTTVAMRKLTLRMQADERIEFSLIPLGDGVSMAVKR